MDDKLKNLLSSCPHRDELPSLLNQAGLAGYAIEIGVAEGGYSEWLRMNWTGQKLFMVDPWLEQPVEDYVDGSNLPQAEQDAKLVECVRKMSVFPADSYELIRAMSVDAVELFPDNYFDFVYLDGNHNYPSIAADVKNWWPKVRRGGIMAGHDYVPDCPTYGVQRAVNEFCAEHDLELFVIPAPVYTMPSWAVIR